MKIIILGAGGVGFWLTTALARQLPLGTKLTVADTDIMEGSGAERLPRGSVFGRTYEGMTKLAALDRFTAYVGRTVPLMLLPERVTAANVVGVSEAYHEPGTCDECDALRTEYGGPLYDLVIDCTDMNIPDRQAIKDAVGAAYLRISYDIADGRAFVIVADHLPFSAEPDRGGYQQPPGFAHAMFAGGVGAEVVLRRMAGQTVELPVRVEIPFKLASAGLEIVEDGPLVGRREYPDAPSPDLFGNDLQKTDSFGGPIGAGPTAELSTVDTELAPAADIDF